MNTPGLDPAALLLPALLDRLSGLAVFLLCPKELFRFVYVNQPALRQLGPDPEQLTAWRYPRDAGYPLIGIERLWQELDDTLHTDMEVRISDGQVQSLPATLHRLTHAGGVYLLGYLQDQHVQQRLVETRQAAERALAVRNRFLAHMSHEFRTPLNGILGLSHMARDTESPALARDYFQQIHRQGLRLQTVLSDVFDFCQIETGTITLHPVSFSPQSLIDDILHATKDRARGKPLLVHSHVDPALPAYLRGDVLRLRHVFHALVDNAVKFTGSGEVRLSMTRDTPANTNPVQVRFTVQDTGPGIDPADCSRLFRPFEQLDPSDNRSHQGLGLSLALAAHLVRLMGGSGIDVDSHPGQGSTFSLVLPFDPAQASTTASARVHLAGELPLTGVNVLVVEDNATNQKIVCALLQKAGATTAVAENGAVAIDCLKDGQASRYDVVLMDIQMPVMDGYTATRQIRSALQLARIPIIALTANALSSDREACLQAGMNDYLTKPVQPRVLVNVILQNLPGPATVLLDSNADSALQLLSLANTHWAFKQAFPNLPLALTSLGNDEHLYCELARLFITQHGKSVERIERLLVNGDLYEAKNLTVMLKGLSNTLGLLPLCQSLSKLEFRLQSCPMSLIMPELEQVHTEMKATIRALRQLLLLLPV
jgi:signal transduction histidine kinase/DNA-binding NarL/FixJ family response regulator